MRSVRLLLAFFLMLSSAVFADDGKSAKDGIRQINRAATDVGHALDTVVNKGAEGVNKSAKKIFKKSGKESKKTAKDKKETAKD
jgi:hypothetical protein